MRELVMIALRRNLAAAEQRGDLVLAERIRARLAAAIPVSAAPPDIDDAVVQRRRGRPRKFVAPVSAEFTATDASMVADHTLAADTLVAAVDQAAAEGPGDDKTREEI